MTISSAERAVPDGSTASSQSFVINLCSSTSPMALAHPSSPELKRYTFFVSRQREDGRERFRLHMGYFLSQEEAEQLLGAVRDVYPAAWAGPAPTSGVARRGKIAPVQLAPAVAQAASAAAAPASAPAPARAPAPAPTPTPAPAATSSPGIGEEIELEKTMSEMRSVLAQLGDDTTPVQKVAPPPLAKPTSPAAPVRPVEPPRLQPVVPKVAASKPAPAAELTPAQTLKVLEAPAAVPAIAASAAPAARATPAISDGAPLKSPFDGLENEPVVRVVTPEDTQTLVDIKIDKDNNAPPCFAVQLAWSVSPIDAASLPHLAIFDAYTLYHVEGNRQGRKWYGLRLGFFTDPHSATQVANYVRGDYRAVAVVPVALKEKDRATGVTTPSPLDSGISPPLRAAEHLSTNREAMNGFELVADDRPAPQKRDLDMPKDPKAVAAAVRAKLDKVLNPAGRAEPATPDVVAKTPGKATGKPNGKRVVVRKRPEAMHVGAPGTAEVLESTLDILGASTLTLDEGKGKSLDDAAATRPPVKKNGKFSKLLSRLSGG